MISVARPSCRGWPSRSRRQTGTSTPSPPTQSLHVRGFDSSRLNSKGWEFSCPLNCIGGLPESLTQGLLVGKLLIGGLGVLLLVTGGTDKTIILILRTVVLNKCSNITIMG